MNLNKNDINKRRKLKNRTLLNYQSHLKSKDIVVDIGHKNKQIYGKSVKKVILIGKDITLITTLNLAIENLKVS